jgi:hypothetical protein
LFLPILETHGDVRGPLRAPEKVEVITDSLLLIELSNCTKHPVGAFKSD